MTKIPYFKSILITIILCFLLPITVFAVPAATDAFYVNDFSNVLDKEMVQYMVERLEVLYERTGAQIVITTVDYTGAQTIGDFATEMYNTYGIGSKEGNGILFLFVTGADNYHILPGQAFESLISQSTADIIFDAVEYPFSEGNYTDAAYNAYLETLSVVEKYYNIDISEAEYINTDMGNYVPSTNKTTKGSIGGYTMVFLFFIGVVVLIMVAMAIPAGVTGRWPFRRRSYYGGSYYRRPFFHWGRNSHGRYNDYGGNSSSNNPPTKNPKAGASNNTGGGGTSSGGGFSRPLSKPTASTGKKSGSTWKGSSSGSGRSSGFGGSGRSSGGSSRSSGSSGRSSGGGGRSSGGGFSRK